MVSRKNVSSYAGEPPAEGSRRIGGGPLYPREEVLAELEAGGLRISLWTRKCSRDLENLSIDMDELRTRFEEILRNGDYRNSEWCEQGTSDVWAACDAYSYTRREWVPTLGRDTRVDYYVKFARSRTGSLLLLVSFHLS